MDPTNNLPAIPWYQSGVIQKASLSVVVQILALTKFSKYAVGLDLAPLVNSILEIMGIGFAMWAAHTRATKPMPPVTITQAAADKVNVTPTSPTTKVP